MSFYEEELRALESPYPVDELPPPEALPNSVTGDTRQQTSSTQTRYPSATHQEDAFAVHFLLGTGSTFDINRAVVISLIITCPLFILLPPVPIIIAFMVMLCTRGNPTETLIFNNDRREITTNTYGVLRYEDCHFSIFETHRVVRGSHGHKMIDPNNRQVALHCDSVPARFPPRPWLERSIVPLPPPQFPKYVLIRSMSCEQQQQELSEKSGIPIRSGLLQAASVVRAVPR